MPDTTATETRWSLPMKTVERGTFDLQLVVATTEPDVVETIEKAAAAAGLKLERVE